MENSSKKTESDERANRIRKQLQSLLSDFYPSSNQYRIYNQSSKRINRRQERMNSVLQALRDSTSFVEQLPPKFRLITLANRYLFYVEIFGNFYVDLALLLLIGTGYALHMMPDESHKYIRHASSLEDIDSPAFSLAVKLDCLESNGLSFFKKWISTTLRNRIAHADFTVDNEGNLSYVDEEGCERSTDLIKEISCFNDYLEDVSRVFREEIKVRVQE